MLPAAHRLRASADFATVTRSGRRARRGSLVVYVLEPSGEQRVSTGDGAACRVSGQTLATPSTVAGLIVGKRVGGSVVRHRVSRRLRAQLAGRIDRVPTGSAIVVRALPEAADAPSAELGRDLDAALGRLATR